MMKNDSVKAVFLLAKFNGCERTLKMDLKSEENSVFRFETEVQVFEKEFRYIFIIASKTEIYYYNQAGLTSYVPSEAHIFRILVNYVQPEWVKNAVFYQIFPERFCNGNPENDVKDGEYIFDGFPCHQNRKPIDHQMGPGLFPFLQHKQPPCQRRAGSRETIRPRIFTFFME